jgi:hypothetical protein
MNGAMIYIQRRGKAQKPVILSIPAKNLHNRILMRFKKQGHPVRQLADQDLCDV